MDTNTHSTNPLLKMHRFFCLQYLDLFTEGNYLVIELELWVRERQCHLADQILTAHVQVIVTVKVHDRER